MLVVKESEGISSLELHLFHVLIVKTSKVILCLRVHSDSHWPVSSLEVPLESVVV